MPKKKDKNTNEANDGSVGKGSGQSKGDNTQPNEEASKNLDKIFEEAATEIHKSRFKLITERLSIGRRLCDTFKAAEEVDGGLERYRKWVKEEFDWSSTTDVNMRRTYRVLHEDFPGLLTTVDKKYLPKLRWIVFQTALALHDSKKNGKDCGIFSKLLYDENGVFLALKGRKEKHDLAKLKTREFEELVYEEKAGAGSENDLGLLRAANKRLRAENKKLKEKYAEEIAGLTRERDTAQKRVHELETKLAALGAELSDDDNEEAEQ